MARSGKVDEQRQFDNHPGAYATALCTAVLEASLNPLSAQAVTRAIMASYLANRRFNSAAVLGNSPEAIHGHFLSCIPVPRITGVELEAPASPPGCKGRLAGSSAIGEESAMPEAMHGVWSRSSFGEDTGDSAGVGRWVSTPRRVLLPERLAVMRDTVEVASYKP
jgi:hypothetical protein